MDVVIYQSLIIFIFVLFYGIVAQQVQLNGNITEEIGSNSTMLTCNFTLGEGEVLKAVLILATNVTVHDFTSVASFDDDFGSKLQPFGKVLFGNVSLTPFNRHLKNVSMSFDDLNCKHSRLYICQIVVKTETDITGTIKKSDPTGISVKVPPSKPDNILLVNIQADSSMTTTEDVSHTTAIQTSTVTLSETETLSTLQTSTHNGTTALKNSTLPINDYNTTFSTPSDEGVSSDIPYSTSASYTEQTTTQDIVEGDNITVVCTGNVGKPPAEYVFQKILNDQIVTMQDTVTTTSISKMSENCSYFRTSNLTFQVTAEDNNAVIRCVVNSSIADPDMYIETEAIEVFYEVGMPSLTVYPNKLYYVVGEDTSIHLNCKSDGNPEPYYQWYKENHNESISLGENFTITDVNITNSGVYTCTVSNTFNGYTYTNASNVQINITYKAYTTRTTLEHSSTLADISTTKSSSTGSSSGIDKKEEKSKGNLGLVVGIVVAVVTVIVVMIVIIACRRRKSKSPTFKNVSNSFDDSKQKPIPEPRTGDYDYIALEDDAPKTKSSNNGLEVEDINKHNEEYLKKQEEEEKKKNKSNTPPQPAVYAQVNEATKSKNKLKTETRDNADKQEEDTYAESQEGIYDKTGDRRHIKNENVEHFDSSTNSSKQNSNGDNKLTIETSQVGSYANQGFEKDENRKVATVSPTVRSSGGSQNDEQTNSNRNSQSQKGYENIIGTEKNGISEEDSHRTAL